MMFDVAFESMNTGFQTDFQQVQQVMVGEDGKSAYEIALENGFVGSQTQWLDSLKGADGKDGKNGVDGKDGQPGPKPVKGVDYWTETDKAELVANVLSALPVYNGEVI